MCHVSGLNECSNDTVTLRSLDCFHGWASSDRREEAGGLMKRSVMSILMALAIPHVGQAQTAQQMEYERQQREYRQQMERQQEQQRQQQKQMEENARRQQEELNRLNRPAPGSTTQGQTPSYSTPAPNYQTPSSSTSPSASQQQKPGGRSMFEPPDSPQWVKLASTAEGDVYGDASSRVRGDPTTLMWAMRDFKKPQETSDGTRYLSTREKLQFYCDNNKTKEMKKWVVTTFSGRMGAGEITSSAKSAKSFPVTAKYEALMKFACAAKPTP